MTKVFLGIDPGFTVTGFGIVSYNDNKLKLIDSGILPMSSKDSLACRVHQFHSFFVEKIREHNVTALALETPFLGKNAQNFLKLGYLRGIVYLLSATHSLELFEFAPSEIRLSVTGFGGADKEQVARVIRMLFNTLSGTFKLDMTDAIAVALCAAWRNPRLSVV